MNIANFSWTSCLHGATSIYTLLRPPLCSRQQTVLSDLRQLSLIGFSFLLSVFLLRIWCQKGSSQLNKSKLLKLITIAHNSILCIGSLLMNLQISHVIWNIYRDDGISQTICTPSTQRIPNQAQLAFYVFLWSKVYELVDTILLVLRSRPLTLLHVWHHFSVMFEVWGWLHFDVTVGLYGMWFNTFVHIFMYAYYTAAVLKIPFPFKKAITATQIIQFLTGFGSLIPFTYLHFTTDGCTGVPGLMLSAFINGTYLFLFLRFFSNTYSSKRKTN